MCFTRFLSLLALSLCVRSHALPVFFFFFRKIFVQTPGTGGILLSEEVCGGPQLCFFALLFPYVFVVYGSRLCLLSH